MVDFSQKFRRPSTGQQQAVALQAPDTRLAQQGNATRRQILNQGIDNLVGLGKGIVNTADKKIKEQAAIRGAQEASENPNSQRSEAEDSWAWGSQTQTQAYNKVRAKSAVRDMPSFVDNYFRENLDKPLDEMTPEERNNNYAEARDAFFQDRGIESSGYREEAGLAAINVQENHLRQMDAQALQLRQAKSEAEVSNAAGVIISENLGDVEVIHSMLTESMDDFAATVGSTEKAQQLIAQGLLQQIGSEDPVAAVSALNYLESDRAKQQFDSMTDYDQVVKQAQRFNQKRINEMVVKQQKEEEDTFYTQLFNGAWSDPAQAKDWLGTSTSFEGKKKVQLAQVAARFIKTAGEADVGQELINQGRFNDYNSLKKDVKKELFVRNIGEPDDFNINNPDPHAVVRLSEHIKRGFDVPDFIKKIGHSNVGNGEWEPNPDPASGRPPKALNNQLNMYYQLSSLAGRKGVAAVFSDKVQAKMDYITTLTKDSIVKPEEFRQRLDEFDKLTEGSVYSNSTMYNMKQELRDPDKKKKLLSWAAEGGQNFLSGPDDLQPVFTFTDMTSQPDSKRSLDYAMERFESAYTVHRAAGKSAEDAEELAKESFQANNRWVTFGVGTTKHAFVPNEYPPTFAEDTYRYLETPPNEDGSTTLIDDLARRNGVSREDAIRKVTAQPSSDFNITRQMAVFYDGVETEITFDNDMLEQTIEQLDTGERRDLLRRRGQAVRGEDFGIQERFDRLQQEARRERSVLEDAANSLGIGFNLGGR